MKKIVIVAFAVAVILSGVIFWLLGGTTPSQPTKFAEESRSLGNNTAPLLFTPSVTPTPVPSPTPVPTPSMVKLSFAGDVMFDSWVGSLIDKNGPEHIVSDLKGLLKKSDISMVNLETPISLRGVKENDKQFTFRAKPEHVNVLTASGINMVTLANNHILDFGLDALQDTLEILKGNNIGFAGAGQNVDEASKPLYITKNDCKVAFIASSHVIPFVSWTAGPNKPGVAVTYDPARTLAEIEEARKTADVVVVYVHWGEEMKNTPVPYQKNLARMYIDKGADIVIGAHPHVLQGLEYYKNSIIAYSLGNFIFTNTRSDTAVLNIELTNKKISSVRIIPCEINNFRTLLVEDAQKARDLFEYIKSISFNADILADGSVVSKN